VSWRKRDTDRVKECGGKGGEQKWERGRRGKGKRRGKESIQLQCDMVRVEYAPKIVESEETEPE
jgi:hypothetical protein